MKGEEKVLEFAEELTDEQLFAVNGGGWFSSSSSSSSSSRSSSSSSHSYGSGSHGGSGSHRSSGSSSSGGSAKTSSNSSKKSSSSIGSKISSAASSIGSKISSAVSSVASKVSNGASGSKQNASSTSEQKKTTGSSVYMPYQGMYTPPTRPQNSSSKSENKASGSQGQKAPSATSSGQAANTATRATNSTADNAPTGMSGCPSTYLSGNFSAGSSATKNNASGNSKVSDTRSKATLAASNQLWWQSTTGNSGSSSTSNYYENRGYPHTMPQTLASHVEKPVSNQFDETRQPREENSLLPGNTYYDNREDLYTTMSDVPIQTSESSLNKDESLVVSSENEGYMKRPVLQEKEVPEIKVDLTTVENAAVAANSSADSTSVQKKYTEMPANSAVAWELSTELADKKNMQELVGTEDDDKMNGYHTEKNKDVKNKFSTVGCKMTSAAKIISDVLGIDVSLTDINEYDANGDGEMTEEEIASAFRAFLEKSDSNAELKTDYWEQQLNGEKLNEIVAKEEGTTYIIGRAKEVHGGDHWIVLTGYSLDEYGQIQFNYSGSSVNDANQNRKYILGENKTGENNFFTITKIETYTLIKH